MQRTPQQYIYKRPGKGGKEFSYVPVHYVTKVLNFNFGWLWDFQVISHEVHGLAEGWGQVVVLGRLTVKSPTGETIVKEQFGQAEVKYLTEEKEGKRVRTTKPVNLGNDFKAGASDSLKKCASELGIASDVYGVNEFREIKIELESDVVESDYDKLKSMVNTAKNDNALKALNLAVSNAKLTDEQKEELYELIKSKVKTTPENGSPAVA